MAAYYNEMDKYAAAWLRNLIAAGAIAPGEVDTRSIVDVRADDLKGFEQHHFFAGIGGWSLALRRAGWPDDRPVWTGSCPCQPFSSAGKREGQADDRHLWPYWFRLIREYRPGIVFGEQVAAAIAYGWLDEVAVCMEEEDYALGAAVLPACAAGAWHRRDRLWFVANALDGQFSEAGRRPQGRTGERNDDTRGAMADAARRGERGGTGNIPGAQRRPGGALSQQPDSPGAGDVENAEGIGRREGRAEPAREPGRPIAARTGGAGGVMGDTEHDGSFAPAQRGSDGAAILDHQGGQDSAGEFEGAGRSGDVADTPGAGSHAGALAGIHSGKESPGTRHGEPERCGKPMGDPGHSGRQEPERGRADSWPPGWGQLDNTDSGIIWLDCPDGKARPVKPGIRLLVNELSPDMGMLRPGEISPYRALYDERTGKPIGQAPWRIGMIKGFGNAIDTLIAGNFIAAAWEVICNQ